MYPVLSQLTFSNISQHYMNVHYVIFKDWPKWLQQHHIPTCDDLTGLTGSEQCAFLQWSLDLYPLQDSWNSHFVIWIYWFTNEVLWLIHLELCGRLQRSKCSNAPALKSLHSGLINTCLSPFSHLKSAVVSRHGSQIFTPTILLPSSCQLWHFAESFQGWLCCMCAFLSVGVTSGSWWWAGTGGRCPSASAWCQGWSIPRPSAPQGSSLPGSTSESPEPGGSKQWMNNECLHNNQGLFKDVKKKSVCHG